MKKNKALFLDRDGVINKYGSYIYKIQDFFINEDIFSLCKSFQSAGYKLIVVTNQAGVARKIFTKKDFTKLNDHMIGEFLKKNIIIDDVFSCFHHPEFSTKPCDCRKPEPGMINRAIVKHNIDPQMSFLIGDSISDIEAGKNANIKNNILIEKNIIPQYALLMRKYLSV
tara:strand:- start:9653 stop:10159 length:507 start_codon:yes stop_codon:yes gene_type:complete